MDRRTETDANTKMLQKSDDSSKSLNSFWEVEVVLLQINHWGSTRDLRFAQARHLEAKSMRAKLVIKRQKMRKIEKLPN